MKRFILISLILTILSTNLFADETKNSIIVYEKGKRGWFVEGGVEYQVKFQNASLTNVRAIRNAQDARRKAKA